MVATKRCCDECGGSKNDGLPKGSNFDASAQMSPALYGFSLYSGHLRAVSSTIIALYTTMAKIRKIMKPIVTQITPQMWATRTRLNLQWIHDLAGKQ